jgi:hypothetical protein
VSHLPAATLSVRQRLSCPRSQPMVEAEQLVNRLRITTLSVHPRPSCPRLQPMVEAEQLVNHLRTTTLRVHSRPNCPHLQPMVEAEQLVNHFRIMTLIVQPRPSCPHRQSMVEVERLVSHLRKQSPISSVPRCRRYPEPKAAALPPVGPWRTASSRKCDPFQPNCARSQPREAAVQSVDLYPPSNPTVHLQRRCPHLGLRAEGVQHLAPSRTMNPTLNATVPLLTGCPRSEPMEEAGQPAFHSHWALPWPGMRKTLQTRAQDQPRMFEAAPAGELQPGQAGAADPQPQVIPPAHSPADAPQLRTAP